MEKIFNNTEVAFALKTDTELDRAYFLFKMIDSEPLVRIGTAVTNFALKAHLPVEGLIRATVFDHFCGGTTEDDCLTVVDKMYTKGVSSVLDYSVEGKEEEAQFDAALEMTLKTIEFAKERAAIPFAVFKPTGFGRFDLYKKIGKKNPLNFEEHAEWDRVVARFETVCKFAHEKDVALLIDGEESWMQDAADELVAQMMKKYNKEKNRVKKLIKQNGCAEHVTLLGFIPDEYLTALFSLADIFVMPSKKEGFGIVFIEAMACGITAIGGNVDGTVDALKNGELGYLINPDDQKSLIEILNKELIIGDKKENKQALQEKVQAIFGYPQYKNQIAHLFLN